MFDSHLSVVLAFHILFQVIRIDLIVSYHHPILRIASGQPLFDIQFSLFGYVCVLIRRSWGVVPAIFNDPFSKLPFSEAQESIGYSMLSMTSVCMGVVCVGRS